MPLMTWTANLSVGVPDLDAQHKQLIGLVNELHDAMAKGLGKAVLQPLLDKLVRYTLTHFSAEERYMAQSGYGALPAHKAEHERLTHTVQDFKRRYDSGQTMLTVEVMTFLKDWLLSHIQGTDRQYAPRAGAHV